MSSQNTSLSDLKSRFGLDGSQNILAERDFGVVNGKITTNVLYSNVLSLRSLFAPPFVSSNFVLDGWICGESIKTDSYSWMPTQVKRQGSAAGIGVFSTLTLIEGQRAFAFEIRLQNTTSNIRQIPLRFDIQGGLDYSTDWGFSKPIGEKGCRINEKEGVIMRQNDTGVVAIASSGLSREGYVPFWQADLTLGPGETKSFWLTLAMGEAATAESVARDIMRNPAEAAQRSGDEWAARAAGLLDNLPRFSASDKRLERFYDRSALHFLLNQWQVPEFILNPYYSTGSINGGCVASYLWDFSEGWELFSIIDPAATREHIKAFLNINLTRHFAFDPMSGAGWGPWYYINQEKIVFLVYYYVLLSGDENFLSETVAGKTILDWMIYQALVGDNLDEEANLIDYGAGNHHLELRRQYTYQNFMPDLNARRYPIYLAAEALCEIAGRPAPVDFRGRAEELKALIHTEMWSEADNWWFDIDPDGGRHLRYTMQMFKLIAGGAISDDEQRKLIARINETEFLGEYGFHSISKLDIAYDQVDVDNGGGGACCCFPPQIAERLYKAGYAEEAEDILERILWWGDRMPYWSDSLVANVIDYRRDTPLQNALGAVAGAQSIIFGIFGVKVDDNGDILINPAPPSYSPEISLHSLKIRNRTLDITVANGQFEVRTGDEVFKSTVGEPLVISVSRTLAVAG